MFEPFPIRLKLVLQQLASVDFLFQRQIAALLVKRLRLGLSQARYPAVSSAVAVKSLEVALDQLELFLHSAKLF
jgi:hypothetical protein